jgi:hypothetical protein
LIDRRWYSDVKKTRLSWDGTAEEVRTKVCRGGTEKRGGRVGRQRCRSLGSERYKGMAVGILRTPH